MMMRAYKPLSIYIDPGRLKNDPRRRIFGNNPTTERKRHILDDARANVVTRIFPVKTLTNFGNCLP